MYRNHLLIYILASQIFANPLVSLVAANTQNNNSPTKNIILHDKKFTFSQNIYRPAIFVRQDGNSFLIKPLPSNTCASNFISPLKLNRKTNLNPFFLNSLDVSNSEINNNDGSNLTPTLSDSQILSPNVIDPSPTPSDPLTSPLPINTLTIDSVNNISSLNIVTESNASSFLPPIDSPLTSEIPTLGPSIQPPSSPEPIPEPTPSPEPKPEPTPSPEPKPEPTPSPEPKPEPTPSPEPKPEPSPSPEPKPEPTPSPESKPEPTPTPEPSPAPKSEPKPEPTPSSSTTKANIESQKSTDNAPNQSRSSTTRLPPSTTPSGSASSIFISKATTIGTKSGTFSTVLVKTKTSQSATVVTDSLGVASTSMVVVYIVDYVYVDEQYPEGATLGSETVDGKIVQSIVGPDGQITLVTLNSSPKINSSLSLNSLLLFAAWSLAFVLL
ncbi:Cell surface glycoprotein 1 [Smittium culicis]|uniref:Cell surface glycoprotein 1 n=1 Tax=Smittium culicis TaxID=133412 RepID=A0A1R1YKP2_9FUNG|nr:Cell surface glycoprotein 1 [Smittium culicis]